MESHLNKSKFYVPNISEFHVGFECEIASINNNWNITGWRKKVIDVSDEFTLFGTHPNLYRVKYLDKEDIESLGWKLYPGHNYEKLNQVVLFSKGKYTLAHSIKNSLITIYITDPTNEGEFPKFIADSIRVNKIKINNKTELKNLLNKLEKDGKTYN